MIWSVLLVKFYFMLAICINQDRDTAPFPRHYHLLLKFKQTFMMILHATSYWRSIGKSLLSIVSYIEHKLFKNLQF